MPKPKKFSYTKKAPFKSAAFFIIICEGETREPKYFRFFDGISSRVKVVTVANIASGSSPRWLIDNAIKQDEELETIASDDRLWFVIDTDRWREQILELRNECAFHPHWRVAQSNPCFEVWLYFHAKAYLPELPYLHECNNWKPLLPKVIKGGFNTDFHPIAIETAVTNSKATYSADGFLPKPGSTQVWQLAEELILVIKKDLELLKDHFPAPEIVV